LFNIASNKIVEHYAQIISSNFDFDPYVIAKRTLRELVAPDMAIQTLYIEYPNLNVECELKSSLINILPKFHALPGEDPHKHLKEFHIVCTTMRLYGVPEEQIKLKAFSFSLQDATKKDWLYYLSPRSVTS